MSILDRMFFTALDNNFDVIEIVDNYSSAIWSERYADVGDFELHGTANDQLKSVAQNAAYLFNSATSTLMVVEKPKLGFDSEDGDTLTITGRSFESFLDRRVALANKTIINPMNAPTSMDTRISKIICDLVTEAYCVPGSARYWPNLEVVNLTSMLSPKLEIGAGLQITMGDVLLDTVMGLCSANGLGFKCLFVPETKRVQFIVYEGVNRTIPGKDLVMFSDLYDNLIAASDETQSAGVKNTAVVTGTKVDDTTQEPFPPVIVGDARWTGLARREVYISTDQEPVVYISDTVQRPMRNDEYVATLTQKGVTELNSIAHQSYKNFEGEIVETDSCRYGHEFALGDVIAFSMIEATNSSARLDGITFSDDEDNGKTLAPTFIYGV